MNNMQQVAKFDFHKYNNGKICTFSMCANLLKISFPLNIIRANYSSKIKVLDLIIIEILSFKLPKSGT